jgi:tetratricopeptide (TPR) repeat protein
MSSDHYSMLRKAMRLERAGRLPEAAAAYESLLARWPDLPDSWYTVALLQRKLRRFDAALGSYQEALDRGVSRPEEVHLNRGVIYSDCLRREDAAERELDTALTPELRKEGLMRELVNRVQQRRKESKFNLTDRIEVHFDAGGLVKEILDSEVSAPTFLSEETLATKWKAESGISDPKEEFEGHDGAWLQFHLKVK